MGKCKTCEHCMKSETNTKAGYCNLYNQEIKLAGGCEYYKEKRIKTGFIIKCRNCGSTREILSRGYFQADTGIELFIDWQHEEGFVKCKCGNMLKF